MIEALAFAHVWFEELESGRVRNIAEIAKRYGFSERHVSDVLCLAFLSPEIVHAIETGKQPIDLTAETLIKRVELPWEWKKQKQVLMLAIFSKERIRSRIEFINLRYRGAHLSSVDKALSHEHSTHNQTDDDEDYA